MKYIDAQQVHKLLDYPSLVEALEQYHRQGVEAAERMLLEQPTDTGKSAHFLIWPAWQRQQALGIKLATIFPDNETEGLPSVQALYILFDGKTGQPTALIDGTALTLYKTAADSALGAKFLAPEDAQTLLMAGAGAMATHLIMAHKSVRPSLCKVLIWNRTTAKAEALAENLKLDDLRITATTDLEAAARKADVISCATMATRPIIRGKWLKPGTHLDLVGGYTRQMREADDEAVRRARVYVDSRWFTLDCCGDLTGPMESGVLTEDRIVADLFQLSQGERPGRQSPDEITFFKNGGGGHLDLMTARFLALRAAD